MLSREQLAAECARRGVTLPGMTHRTYPARPDYQSALRDYLKLEVGRSIPNVEPLALEWHRNRANILAVRNQVTESGAVTSSDFGDMLTDALSASLADEFNDVSGDIASIARPIGLPNYQPQNLAQIGIGQPLEVVEDEPLKKLPFEVSTPDSGVLRQFGGKVSFSKPVWSVFAAEITRALEQYGRVFALNELQIIAQTIEAGSPPTGSGSLDGTGLGVASAALRRQTNAAGQIAATPLSGLLIPPDLEAAARKLRRDYDWQFGLCVNPYLSSASVWYAFGPATRSPLCRLTLRNAKPSLYSRFMEAPAAEFAISHDVNYVLLSDCAGVVKMS